MMISDKERREVARLLRERAGYEMGCVFKELYGDCNSADPTCGECNERAMRYVADLIEQGEPEVKYVAEVKVDGWRIEELAHDAAVELTGIDRDALLELAEKLDGLGLSGFSSGWSSGAVNVGLFARRIREALGVADEN